MSTTITKSEAARVLEDEIFALDEALKKGRTIMQEITDEYFRKFHTKEKDGPTSILWEYGRAGIFADIMDDIVFTMYQTVEELKKIKDGDGQKGEAAA